MSGESHSGLGFHVLIRVEALKLRMFPAKGYSCPTVISFRCKTE